MKSIPMAVCASVAMAGCGSSDNDQQAGPDLNALPAVVTNLAAVRSYDGNTDDLLTAGLGNPSTKEIQAKTVYFEKADDMVFSSGYYRK